jgi:hypothetical protein
MCEGSCILILGNESACYVGCHDSVSVVVVVVVVVAAAAGVVIVVVSYFTP